MNQVDASLVGWINHGVILDVAVGEFGGKRDVSRAFVMTNSEFCDDLCL